MQVSYFKHVPPYLTLIHVNEPYEKKIEIGKKYPLFPERETVIGYDEKAQIHLPRPLVEKQHAKLYFENQKWYLKNLSVNQNTFNAFDLATELYPLQRDGEIFKTGSVVFKFYDGQGVESAYARKVQAQHQLDTLTQIYNRKFLFEQLEDSLSQFLSSGFHHLSLILFDIDNFRNVNNTYGHLAGDFVLKTISAEIQSYLGKNITFARYGGEEFAIFLPKVTKKKSIQLAEIIRSLIENKLILFGKKTIQVTISVGIASLTKMDRTLFHSTQAEPFIRIADEQLYKAKRQGKNQVCG